MAPDRQPKDSWAARLTRRLLPFLGPPQLGPYDEPPVRPDAGAAVCSSCGRPMSEHRVDRSSGKTAVYCPELPS